MAPDRQDSVEEASWRRGTALPLDGGFLTRSPDMVVHMDAEEIRKRVLRYFELVDGSRFEELLELFDPEIIYERGGTGIIRGIDKLRQFYNEQRVIERGKHRLETVLIDGDWAAIRGSFTGVLKTGESVTIRFADFHQFRNGKIWRRYSYFMDRAV